MDLNFLLATAVQAKASDLHITVGTPPVFRVNGMLVPMTKLVIEGQLLEVPDNLKVITGQVSESFARQILSEEQFQKFQGKGELDLSYSLPRVSRFRINIYKQRGCIAMAVRVVPSRIPTFAELQLPEVIKSLALKPKGLVLVTGPTGSGKSTTLAAMIELINSQESCHIITLEDPIEYLHQHKKSIVNQRELGTDTTTFASALRAAMRQDPDVILVGEMRDLETIATAITAAETGHLVFATLHTMDAAQTIDRIIDVFPPNQQQQIKVQLASTLQGVIAQQLLPRADGKGRVAAHEIMVVTPAIRNLIREGKTHQIMSSIQAGGKYGMQTFEASLRRLVHQGLITQEEAFQNTTDQTGLQKYLT